MVWKYIGREWECEDPLRDCYSNLIRDDASLDSIVAIGANCTDSVNCWKIEMSGYFVWIWEREISPKFPATAATGIVVPFTEILTSLRNKLYVQFGFCWVWGDFYIKLKICL